MVIVMDYRKLEFKDLSKAKALWKQAFGDSDSYIDFTFKNNLTLENSLAIFDDEKLACMLFMLPKTLTFEKKEINTYFIVGVSTDNEYRYQGHARSIMENAKEYLFKKDISLVFLYPFNHDFYKKLDYHTISSMRRIEFSKTNSNFRSDYDYEVFDINNQANLEILLNLYNEFKKTKQSYFRRSIKDYELRLKTMYCDDGKILIVSKNGEAKGYVLYFIEKNKVNCLESVFLDNKTALNTLNELSNNYNGYLYFDEKYDIDKSIIEEYAMVQIIDENKAFDFYDVKSMDEFLSKKTMILEQY